MSSAFASPRSFPLRALRTVFRHTALVAACLAAAAAPHLSAQAPGSLDSTFVAADRGYTFFTQVLEFTDDDIPLLFVGGDRGGLNIFDLNGNVGVPYPVLPPFGSAERIIYTAVPEKNIDPDTLKSFKLMVGGLFGRSDAQTLGKLPAQNIFRLTAGALVDDTFKPGHGANKMVTSILTLSDGGMVVGGMFDEFNQITHEHIVRLDSTGAIVPASVFNPGLNFDDSVLSLAAQVVPGAAATDPVQILVAGLFNNVNGVAHHNLARLNPDGSVDASFNPSFDDRTTVVVCQPDGKILVGGDFSNVNGALHKHVVRLNQDGSVDATFDARVTGQPGGFVDPPAVYVIKLLDDGSMYLGGNFTTVNGVTRNYLAHVDASGTLDPTFDPGRTIINAVQSLTVQPDGRIIVGETVSRPDSNNQFFPSLIRLYGVPTFSLVAVDPTATVTNLTQGAFRLTRIDSVPSAGPLTVSVTLAGGKGSAIPELNYQPLVLSGEKAGARNAAYTVTFPTGVDTIRIPVVPLDHPIKTAKNPNGKPVTLFLTDDPSQTATVTITN